MRWIKRRRGSGCSRPPPVPGMRHPPIPLSIAVCFFAYGEWSTLLVPHCCTVQNAHNLISKSNVPAPPKTKKNVETPSLTPNMPLQRYGVACKTRIGVSVIPPHTLFFQALAIMLTTCILHFGGNVEHNGMRKCVHLPFGGVQSQHHTLACFI